MVTPPGARCSALDVLVLVIAGAAAAAVWRQPGAPGAIIVTVVGHFFVFCNVVRLRAALELAWAGTYVVVAAALLARGHDGWVALAAIAPVTATLIALELRRPDYRGLGWRRRRARATAAEGQRTRR